MAELPTTLPPAYSFGTPAAEIPAQREKDPEEPIPGGIPRLYSFRGRDSGVGAPFPTYVWWSGTTPTTSYGGPLTYGGPLVDIVCRRVR